MPLLTNFSIFFFNNTLNTFYLKLYGIRHIVKNHSIARGNLLLPHGLLFSISSKGSFICIIPDRIAHTTTFVTPVVEHWLEREISQWVHHEGSIRLSTGRHMVRIWNQILQTSSGGSAAP